MIVYRLSRIKYKNILSGKGAALRGGRWNQKGTEVVYTAGSRALAMAEVLVHFSLRKLPDDYFMLTVYVPDSMPVYALPLEDLPVNWNIFPYLRDTQNIADDVFRDKKYGVLKLPSAVVKGDHNFLIDPSHSDFSQVKIIDEEPFPFDTRFVFVG